MKPPTNATRKKFLLWGAAIFSSVSVFRFFSGSGKSKPAAGTKNNGTARMLTQDGKLVEVNQDLLAAGHQKISNEELQQWIKK